MPRSRGLDGMSAEDIEKGQLHSVAIDINSTLVIDQDLGRDQLTAILNAGHGLVAPDYAQTLRQASKHKVFPGKMIEERRSAHGVTFGIFTGPVITKKGNEAHGKVLSVAMKPFGEPESAFNEFLGYQVLQRLGIETYDPVGIFPSKFGDNFVVVTKKRSDAVGLDRDTWVRGLGVTSEADIETRQRNTETIKEIAQVLAWVHVNGVFLPDAQVKNFIVTYKGDVGVIDTENLKTLPIGHPDTASLQAEDVNKLLKSLILDDKAPKIFGVGLFAGLSPQQLNRCADELIVQPYTEALGRHAIEQGADVSQADVLDISMRRFLQDPSWPDCLVA